MPSNFPEKCDESILYFSDFLSHLRYMKNFNIEISSFFITDYDLQNLRDFNSLNDMSSLITICNLDLITCSKNLYIAKTDWEKIFFIKNIFLTIRETLKTYDSLSNFLKEKSNMNDSIFTKFSTVSKMLKNFRKTHNYEREIIKIRNNISGHIKDFDNYYDEIKNFDGEKTALIALDFLKVIENIQSLLSEIMKTIEFDLSNINKDELNKILNNLNNSDKRRI